MRESESPPSQRGKVEVDVNRREGGNIGSMSTLTGSDVHHIVYRHQQKKTYLMTNAVDTWEVGEDGRDGAGKVMSGKRSGRANDTIDR
jgi:hypothetical protein